MSSATRRPRHYLRDHLGRALFAAGWTERSRQPTPPLWLPLVIRYSPSSYVNAAHSLRSGLNDWALCGNPFTTKAVSSLRETADNRAPGIIFARPYRNRGRSSASLWLVRLTWSSPVSQRRLPVLLGQHTQFLLFRGIRSNGIYEEFYGFFLCFKGPVSRDSVFIWRLLDSGNSNSPGIESETIICRFWFLIIMDDGVVIEMYVVRLC